MGCCWSNQGWPCEGKHPTSCSITLVHSSLYSWFFSEPSFLSSTQAIIIWQSPPSAYFYSLLPPSSPLLSSLSCVQIDQPEFDIPRKEDQEQKIYAQVRWLLGPQSWCEEKGWGCWRLHLILPLSQILREYLTYLYRLALLLGGKPGKVQDHAYSSISITSRLREQNEAQGKHYQMVTVDQLQVPRTGAWEQVDMTGGCLPPTFQYSLFSFSLFHEPFPLELFWPHPTCSHSLLKSEGGEALLGPQLSPPISVSVPSSPRKWPLPLTGCPVCKRHSHPCPWAPINLSWSMTCSIWRKCPSWWRSICQVKGLLLWEVGVWGSRGHRTWEGPSGKDRKDGGGRREKERAEEAGSGKGGRFGRRALWSKGHEI